MCTQHLFNIRIIKERCEIQHHILRSMEMYVYSVPSDNTVQGPDSIHVCKDVILPV